MRRIRATCVLRHYMPRHLGLGTDCRLDRAIICASRSGRVPRSKGPVVSACKHGTVWCRQASRHPTRTKSSCRDSFRTDAPHVLPMFVPPFVPVALSSPRRVQQCILQPLEAQWHGHHPIWPRIGRRCGRRSGRGLFPTPAPQCKNARGFLGGEHPPHFHSNTLECSMYPEVCGAEAVHLSCTGAETHALACVSTL